MCSCGSKTKGFQYWTTERQRRMAAEGTGAVLTSAKKRPVPESSNAPKNESSSNSS